MDLWKKMALPPPPLKSYQLLATRYTKILATHKKISVSRGSINHNKDTNTDYQKFVRAEDQKWENAEIKIGIIFSAEDLYSQFFIYTESFQVLPEKNHLKSQFPPKVFPI